MSRSIASRIPDLAIAAIPSQRPGVFSLAEIETDHKPLDEQALARKLAAEFARGRAEGKADAEKANEDALLAERLRLREASEDQQRRFEADQGERLAASVTSGLADLEARLGDSVARILEPFLQEAVADHVVKAFGEHLKTLLAGSEQASLVVRGPEGLLERLKECLGDTPIGIRLEPVDSIEITVAMNDTTIETQLGAWLRRLEDAQEHQ